MFASGAREVPRLTALSHGAGCACKLGPAELASVLDGLGAPRHPDLIVGTDHGDDALVWRRPDGRSLVATTDFFTPIVDDPHTWGRIAATNAASDIHAMGATPLFALNLVGWPRDTLSLDLLGEVLAGGRDAADAGGWIVGGGHSIDSPVPLYGQAVIGELEPGVAPLTNAGARAGQALVLTKAIGTGVVATAVKRLPPEAVIDGGPLAGPYEAAVASMVTPNAEAARIARAAGATAMTDVTGFGLLGHLHKLALASGLVAEVVAAAVPILTGVPGLIAEGFVPGGTQRNREWVATSLDASGVAEETLLLLADAQTSGGLLFSADAPAAHRAATELRERGHAAAMIGQLTDGASAGLILVR